MTLSHHIGGLEKLKLTFKYLASLHHRIGGLEIVEALESDELDLHHRIGSLEESHLVKSTQLKALSLKVWEIFSQTVTRILG